MFEAFRSLMTLCQNYGSRNCQAEKTEGGAETETIEDKKNKKKILESRDADGGSDGGCGHKI